LNGGGGAGTPSGSPALLHKLFDKYREDAKNAPDTIGADGSMKYLTDLGADLEDLDCLAALEIVQAPSMGEIGREGFVKGWSNLKYAPSIWFISLSTMLTGQP
jgi:DCN1-like protein 1/2